MRFRCGLRHGLLFLARAAFGAPSAWALSCVAERWFKGEAAAEVRVLLPLGFRPGARILVFARINPLADRLRQAGGRRRYLQMQGKVGDPDVAVPDVDIPDLTAAGACATSAFPLNKASGGYIPDVRDAGGIDRVAALTNKMLKVLEVRPAAGSGADGERQQGGSGH
jgi:hypothetical protein